jgi:hypothetical protein
MIERKLSDEEVTYFLTLQLKAQREAAKKRMMAGALWTIGGLVITAITYVAAEGGGTYVIMWGAMVFGVIQFFRGLSQY